MTAPTAPEPARPPGTPAARLVGVRVTRGGHDALLDVDLDVARGELTVLAGPNGAGKSTLVEVLARVLPPTSGQVVVEAGSVAFVPQRSAVPDRLPVTVREVVAMGTWGEAGLWRRVGPRGRERAREAVDLLGMTPLARRPFATLSGGERQRALLAQGLARGAGLLLLDEPTTGLDALSSRHIREAVAHQVAAGAAVVCVSHDPVVIDLADRVLHLDRGRVVLEDAASSPAAGTRRAG
ncbi:ATP-binding cassette domain-containing protein [Nocardioides dongxiaopingii]|uniref:zinc ABC transporter ATP-binding protein AztA n=1 Tax=Nocardioides sp. S-1144 TaxID=2582905 RepID=UPI001162F704|nr:zinc ABC transporter ATP-binding protein AztA [Nocardioides sp. S-1144]QDH10703.1 ATP-binding cassette domain-containing protein [Nocardioides sp. S-1144]